MNETIHAITALTLTGDRRVFGFYFDPTEARMAVNENRCNMHEGLYSHLVVEEFPSGIHALAIQESWFCWNKERARWEVTQKPEKLYGIISFAMG